MGNRRDVRKPDLRVEKLYLKIPRSQRLGSIEARLTFSKWVAKCVERPCIAYLHLSPMNLKLKLFILLQKR